MASTVRVTMDGIQLGVMSIREARQHADSFGLDLVEVAPHANPPVCQIMDYGKYKFDQNKQKKQAKKNQKQVEMKEIQVTPVIGDHDLNTKVSSLKKFIEEGRQVQVTCIFSRRQIAFKDQGIAVIDKITDAIKGIAIQESAPKFAERRLQVRFRPSPKDGK